MEKNERQTESARQAEYIRLVRQMADREKEQTGRSRTFHVTTFGCQMNARDSEKLRGILTEMGFQETEEEQADFVLYNTCTVRENANLKVYGRLGHLKTRKEQDPDLIIALCGCMMQEPDVVAKIKDQYGFVDLVFGTHNIFKLAELVYRRLTENQPVIDVWEKTDEIVEDLPNERKYFFKSGVNIMYGCNNFCSYCIVPYVRGRERSRKPEDIVREVESLVSGGVVEVMLLGQNVNSYGKTLEEPVSFAQLLRMLEDIDGLKRIRFMTPHPKDLSDELIETMAASKKICRHVHLPLQSGSSRILQKMNRHYTKEHYLALVRKIRASIPDVGITTDIIIGFPGETEEDFLETLDVVSKARFDSAYTFLYSKRTGTPAAEMADQIPDDIAKERFNRLLALLHSMAESTSGKLVGHVEDVLVEEKNSRDPALVTGRLSNNMTVHFPGSDSLIGTIVPVKLTQAKGFYYFGEQMEDTEL